MKFILSTAPLVQEFGQFERLFEFHDGGIRGIIEESLLSLADILIMPNSDLRYSALINKVLAKYENSVQYRALEYSYPDADASVTIEYVLGIISNSLFALMQNVFMGAPYEIKTDRLVWVGDDIIVKVIHYKRVL